ncbi:alpha/beta fold hydrolase [Bdellovibrio sp.]|uniref:alpha/beta fold hydrolase n=2 Tax=Bdellovibrio TaxID=958 RepID=UPI003222103F
MQRQWVLIRGIMSESYHWWNFLPQLQEHFPQDHFHTADILGNGRLNSHKTPLSLSKNIQALRGQAPADGKKILFGFSLGGMLALEWAHRHSDEVAAVILINASLNNSPFYKRMTPYSFGRIFQSALQKDLHKREEMIIRMTTTQTPQESVNELAQQWSARSLELPVRPANFLWQLGLATQVRQRKEPPAPVLVLSSAKDRVVHPQCSEKIASTWDLPLVRHPEAGHDLTLDDPKWVLEQVSQFITSGLKA